MAKAIDRGLENREIVLGVLTEVLDKGNFVHLVLNQALSKYQYLEKPDPGIYHQGDRRNSGISASDRLYHKQLFKNKNRKNETAHP